VKQSVLTPALQLTDWNILIVIQELVSAYFALTEARGMSRNVKNRTVMYKCKVWLAE